MEHPREIRGLAILAIGNQIKRIDPDTYKVRSQSGHGWYTVRRDFGKWRCECPDFTHRNEGHRDFACKHIHCARFSIHLRERVTRENLGFPEVQTAESICPKCGNTHIIKRGFIKTSKRRIQRFSCKVCGQRFTQSIDGFHKMQNKPEVVTAALDLYFKGVSLRKTADHLKQFYHVTVSQVSILRWIRKYVALMKSYVDDLQPEVSGLWHADEMFVKVNGDMKYLWNLIDHETRFLIANQLTNGIGSAEARRLFAEGKARTGKKPMIIVTDKLQAYSDAYGKEFFTFRAYPEPRTMHIQKPEFGAPINNCVVERLHGSIRDREKTFRGLDNLSSTCDLMDGYAIYYNFIRPHMALENHTPAEIAAVPIQLGTNKWLDLIRQAARQK